MRGPEGAADRTPDLGPRRGESPWGPEGPACAAGGAAAAHSLRCSCQSPCLPPAPAARAPVYPGSFPLVSGEHRFNDGHFSGQTLETASAEPFNPRKQRFHLAQTHARPVAGAAPVTLHSRRAGGFCPAPRTDEVTARAKGPGPGHPAGRWWGWLALGTGFAAASTTAAPPCWLPPPHSGQSLQEAPDWGHP